MVTETGVQQLERDQRRKARRKQARPRRDEEGKRGRKPLVDRASSRQPERDVRWARLTSAQLPPDDAAALEWRGGPERPVEGA